jgi:hypothetical protein
LTNQISAFSANPIFKVIWIKVCGKNEISDLNQTIAIHFTQVLKLNFRKVNLKIYNFVKSKLKQVTILSLSFKLALQNNFA